MCVCVCKFFVVQMVEQIQDFPLNFRVHRSNPNPFKSILVAQMVKLTVCDGGGGK